MADTTESWYDVAFAEYLLRSTYPKELCRFFRTLDGKLSEFSEIETYLSIGPARGDMDSVILASLPRCKSYTGIEPSVRSVPHLTAKLTTDHPNVTLNIVTTKLESWSGPDSPVDMIIASHVLYYVTKPHDEIIRLLEWLRPGGLLVIVLAEGNAVSKVARECFGAKYGTGQYQQKSMKLGLAAIKANVVLEEPVVSSFDQSMINTDVANFLLQRQANDKECEELIAYLNEQYPDGKDIFRNWVTVVQKI